jgi:ankyrin repeat protein
VRRFSVGISCFAVLFVLGLSSQAKADSSKDLLNAVNNSDLAKAQKALHKGASPDTVDATGISVLVLAAGRCESEIVDLLIKSGASVEKYGQSAFQAATHCDCWESQAAGPSRTAVLLLEHGVAYPAPGATTCTDTWKTEATDALKTLATKGDAAALNAEFAKSDGFLKQYADVSASLRAAVDSDKPECAKLLLEKGANPNVGDERGETSLMSAADQDRIDLAQMLIGAGADLSHTDAAGQRAVGYAILSGDDALIQMLEPSGQTLSLSLATVAKEHEVYVWKTSGDANHVTRWKIKSGLGKADVALKSVAAENPIMSMVGDMSMFSDLLGLGNAFLKLSLAPSSLSDSIVFDSGTWQLGMNGKTLSAPIAFLARLPATGERIWAASDGQTLIMLQPTISISKEGGLMLGGVIAILTDNQFGSSTVTAQDAGLSGTIRFPTDHSMEVKPGFRIRGGGLQFDETGISLMPGTHYVKDSATPAGAN